MNTVSPETLIERFDKMAELAAAQPKIDLEDPRVNLLINENRHEQFRNTFFMRFVEVRAITEGSATPQQITYVRMYKERFGYDLTKFPVEHPDLITDIYKSLDAKKPYDELEDYRNNLLRAKDLGTQLSGLAYALDMATNHPLGLEAIGMYYWDSLNPLLESAYNIIDVTNINAPFLGR